MWKTENRLSTGALWIEFLRFYTEQCNYEEHVVTIRQIEPLFKHEKGWFRQTIAIEDPFELSHNLAGGLSPRSIFFIDYCCFSLQLNRFSTL
jgi:terminal uridylyltransferase